MKAQSSRWFRFLASVPGIIAVSVVSLVAAPPGGEIDGSTYARVRHVENVVTLIRLTDSEIAEASPNSPLAPGDRIATGPGRVEVELADGALVWLDEQTELHVRSLADIENEYEKINLLALQHGSVRVDVHDTGGPDAVFRIDTEAGSIYLLSGGSFRVDAAEGMTTLSSFRGVAEFSGDTGSVLVRSGERSSVRSTRSPAEPRRFNTLRVDDFDRFHDERVVAYLRDREDEPYEEIEEDLPRQIQPYVSELSVYGGWHRLPDYGWVWRPVYAGAWSPYTEGRWTWCPAGWVWVSYEPWGWAPYHYGRWDFAATLGWVWIPGSRWSGAWVSFAVGSGYIGWSPLNYYNYPVFHDRHIVKVVNVNVTRLDPRGWRFVRTGHFGRRDGRRGVLRGNRVPRATDLVVTRNLPRFDPRSVAARPERGARLVERVRVSRTPLQVAEDRSGKPVPFRAFERRGQSRGRAGSSLKTLDPRAGIRTETGPLSGREGVRPPGRGDRARREPAARGGKTARKEPGLKDDGEGIARPSSERREDRVRPDRKRSDHVVERLFKRLFEGARKRPSHDRVSPRRPGKESTGTSAREKKETEGKKRPTPAPRRDKSPNVRKDKKDGDKHRSR